MFSLCLFAVVASASTPVDHRDVLKRAYPHPLTESSLAVAPPAMQDAWDVVHYEIQLGLVPALFTVVGDIGVTVQARIDQPDQPLLLHAGSLFIQLLEVDGLEADYSRSGDELWVTMPETISAGESVHVRVVYEAPGIIDSHSLTTGVHWGDPIYSCAATGHGGGAGLVLAQPAPRG